MANVIITIITGSIRPVLIVVRLTTRFLITLTAPFTVFGSWIFVLCNSLKETLTRTILSVVGKGILTCVL